MAEAPELDDDRREGDRRADERREHRREEGRRDPEARERRGRRRWVRPLILLLIGAVLALGWRAAFVAPKRLAEVESERGEGIAIRVGAKLALPMLAVPGIGGPVAGDPGVGEFPVVGEDREALRGVDLRLGPALAAAPGVPRVAAVLGPVRFMLGRERDARIAWETLLRVGDEEDAGRARIGLGVLAIRAGLRATDEQDALFALDYASSQLERVPADHPWASAAAFDRALIARLRGRTDDAKREIDALEAIGRSDLSGLLRDAALPPFPRPPPPRRDGADSPDAPGAAEGGDPVP